MFLFLFKQKTAYEMRISDWSSDVCSSDLAGEEHNRELQALGGVQRHQRDHALVVVTLGDVVGVGHQTDLLEESGERPLGVAGLVQIGRASCRERVCQYVSISVVAGSLKKNLIIVAHEPNYDHKIIV